MPDKPNTERTARIELPPRKRGDVLANPEEKLALVTGIKNGFMHYITEDGEKSFCPVDAKWLAEATNIHREHRQNLEPCAAAMAPQDGLREALEEAEKSLSQVLRGIGWRNSRPYGVPTALDKVREALAANPAAQQAAPATRKLHPKTDDLVNRFADALKDKLAEAEAKYGYSDGWSNDDWMADCQRQLIEHTAKGDPRDVANYCAFAWHHGWPTKGVDLEARTKHLVAALDYVDGMLGEFLSFGAMSPDYVRLRQKVRQALAQEKGQADG